MPKIQIERFALLLSTCFILLYVLGYIFPNLWWGTHFFSFLDGFTKLLLSTLVIGLLFIQFRKNSIDLSGKLNFNLWFRIIASVIFCFLIYKFPVIKDYYGDAYKYLDLKNKLIPIIPDGTHEAFFSLSIAPDAGEQKILAIITYLGYFFKVDYLGAFQILNSIFGGLFFFTWIYFINNQFQRLFSKIIMILAGFSAPWMLFFFGHMEIYAPIYFFNLLWLTLAIQYIKNNKRIILIILGILLPIAVLIHSSALLYLPGLLFVIVKPKNFTWRKVGIFLFAPIAIAGSYLYFFYFEDHIDDRSFRNGTIKAWEHLFLPLFSPEAPLQRYNMLSFNHIFDYFNMILLWSPITLFVFLFIVLTKRKVIHWNKPEVLFIGSITILYMGLFFVINPLISMPRDWDLFSLPAIPLLILTTILYTEVEDSILNKNIIANIAIVFVLSCSIFPIHYDRNKLGNRLEALAFRINDSYYVWTSETFSFANDCRNKNPNYIQLNEKIIDKLRPNAQKGIDYEFAEILYEQGKAYYNKKKLLNSSLEKYEEALVYFPNHNQSKMKMIEPYFLQQRYDEAFELAKDLTQIGYPNPEKAHRIALHCAIEAEQFNEALLISTYYTKNWKNDFINEVHNKLTKGDSLNQIKYMFKR